MFEDLAAATGLQTVAIGVMVAFVLVFVGIVVRVWRRDPARTAHDARLPLDGDGDGDDRGS
jgi:hypothetical protein